MPSRSSASQLEPFLYTGGEVAVPRDASHVRVDPAVTVIPAESFSFHLYLEDVELPEGLREIGRYAFYGCCKLRRIIIPSTVRSISEGAFSHCKALERVNIPEGVIAIEKYSFRSCRSLRRINLSSSVVSIGHYAFRATRAPLHLPDGVETIEDGAFSECKFRSARVPPPVSKIGRRAFYSCRRVFSLELPESLRRIEEHAFRNCTSLRNIAIPPNADTGGLGLFDGCDDLIELFGTNHQRTEDALAKRFDGLPMHELCYHQSYHDTETSLDSLRNIMAADSDGDSCGQDCLGMTPLHILACSKKQDIKLYELLQQYPNSFITTDSWGCLPIFYAMLSDAPLEILNFFVDRHASLFPDRVIDAGRMVNDLSRYGAQLGTIKYLLGLEHQFFPIKIIQWEEIVENMAASEKSQRVPIEIFRFLVRFSISKRVKQLGIKQWRSAFNKKTERIMNLERENSLNEIIAQLRLAEGAYRRLKETTSVLELALWKAKMSESNLICLIQGGRRRGKRLKIDKAAFVRQCRTNCGAEAVIPHVLAFLVALAQ